MLDERSQLQDMISMQPLHPHIYTKYCLLFNNWYTKKAGKSFSAQNYTATSVTMAAMSFMSIWESVPTTSILELFIGAVYLICSGAGFMSPFLMASLVSSDLFSSMTLATIPPPLLFDSVPSEGREFSHDVRTPIDPYSSMPFSRLTYLSSN